MRDYLKVLSFFKWDIFSPALCSYKSTQREQDAYSLNDHYANLHGLFFLVTLL